MGDIISLKIHNNLVLIASKNELRWFPINLDSNNNYLTLINNNAFNITQSDSSIIDLINIGYNYSVIVSNSKDDMEIIVKNKNIFKIFHIFKFFYLNIFFQEILF